MTTTQEIPSLTEESEGILKEADGGENKQETQQEKYEDALWKVSVLAADDILKKVLHRAKDRGKMKPKKGNRLKHSGRIGFGSDARELGTGYVERDLKASLKSADERIRKLKVEQKARQQLAEENEHKKVQSLLAEFDQYEKKALLEKERRLRERREFQERMRRRRKEERESDEKRQLEIRKRIRERERQKVGKEPLYIQLAREQEKEREEREKERKEKVAKRKSEIRGAVIPGANIAAEQDRLIHEKRLEKMKAREEEAQHRQEEEKVYWKQRHKKDMDKKRKMEEERKRIVELKERQKQYGEKVKEIVVPPSQKKERKMKVEGEEEGGTEKGIVEKKEKGEARRSKEDKEIGKDTLKTVIAGEKTIQQIREEGTKQMLKDDRLAQLEREVEEAARASAIRLETLDAKVSRIEGKEEVRDEAEVQEEEEEKLEESEEYIEYEEYEEEEEEEESTFATSPTRTEDTVSPVKERDVTEEDTVNS